MTNAAQIGTPGVAWRDAEKQQWRELLTRKRSYEADVLQRLAGRREIVEYGVVTYGTNRFPLKAFRTSDWRSGLPTVLVTGGVHGYETSGVMGALRFIEAHAADYAGRINLIVAPCVSPWSFEHIQRWNFDAVDPNRSFTADRKTQETGALMKLVAGLEFLVHIDLHETTDTDESEFRPALAARDGKVFEPGTVPDGFYLVADSDKPEPDFQRAIIAAVERVTHIAPPDEKNQIIGEPVVSPGVITYDIKSLFLCTSTTGARFTTTTEVYPDSPRATPEQCTAAQVAATKAAIDFALAAR